MADCKYTNGGRLSAHRGDAGGRKPQVSGADPARHLLRRWSSEPLGHVRFHELCGKEIVGLNPVSLNLVVPAATTAFFLGSFS